MFVRCFAWTRDTRTASACIFDSMLEHLIVDSGAIIKGCGYEFHKTSKRFWTVQDVINEIRDSKSLHLLETLPFELEIRLD